MKMEKKILKWKSNEKAANDQAENKNTDQGEPKHCFTFILQE